MHKAVHRAEHPTYDAVVFAGGGCRCIWQAGFWSVAAPALDLKPRVIAAVSAGATTACALLAGRMARVLRLFQEHTRNNRRNVYPLNPLRGEPLFPHLRFYRDMIGQVLDASALERLHGGPDLRVLVGRPPSSLGPRSGVLLGLLLYEIERRRPPVHAKLARRAGFTSEAISVRSCATPRDLEALLLHSACAPPLTPFYRRGGRPVLDGSLVDNAPVHVVDGVANSLILLTRRFPEDRIPRVPGRTYLQPSQPIPISRLDYTSPERLLASYDLGRRDAERFVVAPPSDPARVRAGSPMRLTG